VTSAARHSRAFCRTPGTGVTRGRSSRRALRTAGIRMLNRPAGRDPNRQHTDGNGVLYSGTISQRIDGISTDSAGRLNMPGDRLADAYLACRVGPVDWGMDLADRGGRGGLGIVCLPDVRIRARRSPAPLPTVTLARARPGTPGRPRLRWATEIQASVAHPVHSVQKSVSMTRSMKTTNWATNNFEIISFTWEPPYGIEP